MSQGIDARPAPSLLVRVAWVILIVGAVMVLVGAWRTGISFDEPYHVLRLRGYFDHDWFLLADDLEGGEPGPWVRDTYVYAPVAALLCHVANVVAGHESWGEVSVSATAYAVRHEVIAVLGLATVAAAGRLTRLVVGGRGWGVVGAATLMAVPMWPGHSMMNIKDVPVGAGFTFFTLGLALLFTEEPRPRSRAFGAIGLVAVGILLTVGTRPGMWAGLAASAGLLTLALLGPRYRMPWADLRWRAAQALLALVVATTLLVFIYPEAFASGRWLLASVSSSSSYRGEGVWWWIPRGVVVGVPTLLLVLGCGGLLIAALHRRTRRDIALLLVLSQALVMPGLAILRQVSLYDELRQVLFACPAWAVLFAFGMARTWETLEAPWLVRNAYAALCGAALLVPLVVQGQLFPYGYAYASGAADLAGLPTSNDYWRTSMRELAMEVPADQFLTCKPEVALDGRTLRVMTEAGRAPALASQDCRTDDLSPIGPYRRFLVDKDDPVADSFAVLTATSERLGRNCQVLDTVSRHRLWTTQTMSILARCHLALLPYPDGGIDLDSGGDGDTLHLLGGWTSSPADQGVLLAESSGSLGWELAPAQQGQDLIVTLEVTGAPPAAVLVNNRQVRSGIEGNHVRVEVDADVARSFGAGRLVLTLRRGDGDLRLTRVDVT